MIPQEHMLWGFIFSLFCYICFPSISIIGIFVVFICSVCIDVDHYFASVRAGNGWSLKSALYWYSIKKKDKQTFINKTFLPFHSIEFLLLLGVCLLITSGWIQNLIFCAMIGFIFHILLDWCHIIIHKEHIYYKVSFIYTMLKHKII